jgi:hypothetical protein
VAEASDESANLAQLAFWAEALEAPLMPISKLESHVDDVPAIRLPSALKKRTACWPEPGLAGVPLAGEASKLPEGLFCLKMIRMALGPVETTVGRLEVEVDEVELVELVELEDEVLDESLIVVWNGQPGATAMTASSGTALSARIEKAVIARFGDLTRMSDFI